MREFFNIFCLGMRKKKNISTTSQEIKKHQKDTIEHIKKKSNVKFFREKKNKK